MVGKLGQVTVLLMYWCVRHKGKCVYVWVCQCEWVGSVCVCVCWKDPAWDPDGKHPFPLEWQVVLPQQFCLSRRDSTSSNTDIVLLLSSFCWSVYNCMWSPGRDFVPPHTEGLHFSIVCFPFRYLSITCRTRYFRVSFVFFVSLWTLLQEVHPLKHFWCWTNTLRRRTIWSIVTCGTLGLDFFRVVI